MEHFGERLRGLRQSRGISQQQVADYLGVNRTTYVKYETGRSEPNFDTLIKLATCFDVTGDYLIGCSNDPHGMWSFQKESAPSYSGEALRIAKRFDELDEYGQSAIKSIVDVETARCVAQKVRIARGQTEESAEIGAESVLYYFPMYETPMSAGAGQIAGQGYPETVRLVKEPPLGASYIAPVRGNSMEPTYQDGQLLFIHAVPEIEPGQVGVFLMDGQQWVKELGDGVLISHNREYEPIPFEESIQCQGLVLGVCDESYFA